MQPLGYKPKQQKYIALWLRSFIRCPQTLAIPLKRAKPREREQWSLQFVFA